MITQYRVRWCIAFVVAMAFLSAQTSNAYSALVTAGTLFVDVKALDLTVGQNVTSWTNNGSGGNFALGNNLASGPVVGTVAGVQAVQFRNANDWLRGPLSIAGITGNSARSVEVWVHNSAFGDGGAANGLEENMVAWGARGSNGQNFAFAYGARFGIGHWNASFDGGWDPGAITDYFGNDNQGPPALAEWHHLAYVVETGGTTFRLYIDGQLFGSKTTAGLNTFAGTDVLIGAQHNNNTNTSITTATWGNLDIARIRIHTEALTAIEVANNYQAGLTEVLIPEPTSAMVLGLGLPLFLMSRRRR